VSRRGSRLGRWSITLRRTIASLNATAIALVPLSILCIFGVINFIGTQFSGVLITFVNILSSSFSLRWLDGP
jgi:hypothetical protein